MRERENALLPDAKCTSSKRHTLAGPTTEISRLSSEGGREGDADLDEGGGTLSLQDVITEGSIR